MKVLQSEKIEHNCYMPSLIQLQLRHTTQTTLTDVTSTTASDGLCHPLVVQA